MPNVMEQFNGGVLIYSSLEHLADEEQHDTVAAYSAACQALNALNRVRMQWQKQNKKGG